MLSVVVYYIVLLGVVQLLLLVSKIYTTKVLLKSSGTIHAFITKRELTDEEKSDFGFGGEAIGFFMLRQEDVPRFIALYENNEPAFRPVLWEIPFTEFARNTPLHPWNISPEGCFEIDTREDYSAALNHFQSHPDLYQLP